MPMPRIFRALACAVPVLLASCGGGGGGDISACPSSAASGAVADRMKFAAWAVFIPLWALVVYSTVAHWVFAGG